MKYFLHSLRQVTRKQPCAAYVDGRRAISTIARGDVRLVCPALEGKKRSTNTKHHR